MSDQTPPGPPSQEPLPSWMQSPPSPSSYGPGAVVPREHPQGTLILVIAIVGIVGTCWILGPIAWYLGNRALAEIDADPGAYTNRGTVNVGRVLGMICSIMLIVVTGGLLVLAAVVSVFRID